MPVWRPLLARSVPPARGSGLGVKESERRGDEDAGSKGVGVGHGDDGAVVRDHRRSSTVDAALVICPDERLYELQDD